MEFKIMNSILKGKDNNWHVNILLTIHNTIINNKVDNYGNQMRKPHVVVDYNETMVDLIDQPTIRKRKGKYKNMFYTRYILV